uniref:Tail sheath protein n=1 Tax=Myoviridae sp. ctFCq8 TaxID=2827605 RepID=A0A8S5LI66_9CAUD|nr:MAG TPA: tail sheath protein [Myoviridae sp. ctFCq8]
MLTIIQGNDTTVSVLLHSQSLTLPDNEGKSYVERSKIDLSQAKDISVRLIPYMRWRPITPSFEVKGSTIIIHYPASVQRPGKWDVEITFLTPEGGGYRQNRVRQSFAEVIGRTKGANSPEAYVITVDVAQAVQGAKGDPGDKGDPGKSSYELAQEEEGFTGTKQEYLKSLHGAPGKDLYQAAVERGYKGSFDDFLETQKGAPGAPGKSNYERAKELEGFQGTELEYLASLHGAPGEGIYKMAVRKGFVGSEEAYLKSQKGKDAYDDYLETTTDNPKKSRGEWAAINAITTQYLYRINKGTEALMNEQTMSADQLMELERHRRDIINALRSKGAQVSDDDGLEALGAKIGALSIYVPIIFRSQQFIEWKETSFPTMQLYESYRPADLSYCFARNPFLTKIPEVRGIENAANISNLANSCSSLTNVSLPVLPTVQSAESAFSGCSALATATIGSMPKVTSVNSFFQSCQSLETATIGSMPKTANTNLMCYNCTSLKSISLDLSGGEITSSEHMFNGCSKLTAVTGVIDLTRSQRTGNMFGGCSSLEEVRIKGLKTDLDLSACVSLSTESVKYLVDNLQQTAGKSISLPRSWQQEHTTEARDNAKAASQKGFTLNFR